VRQAGVSLEKLRALFPVCEDLFHTDVQLVLNEDTATILDAARDVARLHGAEGSITSDHMLLALLEKNQTCRALLESIGLNFTALQERIAPAAAPLRLDIAIDLTHIGETIDTARIVDASANRAREGLRVLEDFARFVRGDALVSAGLKSLRHDLAGALDQLPANLLLQARDTLHDVGTSISTPRELQRGSPLDVARANAKRLQEALRSLEEYGKILDPVFAGTMERLRYDSYTLERALLAGPTTQLAEARLYVLVTESLCRASLVGTVREAIAGGAQIIQLREKDRDDRTLLELARDLRRMTRSAGALFIVNDRADIALLAEADGVHLGQEDLPVQEARRLLGADVLIGVSTHNLEQVRRALLEGASYLGVGPTFASKTKDFKALAGLEFVKQVATETSLPAFVLGGVTPANLGEVLAAGGTRVAVSHAVCAAEDPKKVAAGLRKLLGD
jgi:thiamine-phosphate pyrophosphorylase